MHTKGKVHGIISNLVIVNTEGAVAQNEICMINHQGTDLMAEIIKITGNQAFVQVFESTSGIKVGSEVTFTGQMLEVTLGPGILSKNYDGLQNDLDKMTGVFLKKGEYTYPLDEDKLWKFEPSAIVSDIVYPGSWLGEVTENWMPHKIMVPFKFKGSFKVKWVAPSGEYKADETIAVVTDVNGTDHNITMIQKWPVKVPIKAYKKNHVLSNYWKQEYG